MIRRVQFVAYNCLYVGNTLGGIQGALSIKRIPSVWCGIFQKIQAHWALGEGRLGYRNSTTCILIPALEWSAARALEMVATSFACGSLPHSGNPDANILFEFYGSSCLMTNITFRDPTTRLLRARDHVRCPPLFKFTSSPQCTTSFLITSVQPANGANCF